MNKTVAIGILFVFTMQSVDAIVIRHDINPDTYLADETDFPGVFNLITSRKGHRDCPVTLIAESWGITAAHCAEAPRVRQAMISSTPHPVTINGEANAITKVVTHPSWQGEPGPGVFDLALVQLEKPVLNITPYPLFQDNTEQGQIVTVIGWGGTGNGLIGVEPEEDGIFRKAENKVDMVYGSALVWNFSNPENPESGTLPLEGISGPGDSGGPAFINTDKGLALAGISSGQDNYENFPGGYDVLEYYARISTAVDWINEIITE